MKKEEKDDDIKFIITNPERIPIAQEKLIKFLYDDYIKTHDLKDLINKKENKENE
jgi:hypothetical protein